MAGDTYAVIERDKLAGPAAALKRVHLVDLPAKGATHGQQVPVLRKRLGADVLPALRASNGWTQEKLEGLAFDGRRTAYAVTDNDALKDATGETVFLRQRIR
ncbi:esterase-like activity of phytase family protein [Mobilicoccus massiliensis]|uniref:esterase-like activity of phytase family protein n=1 Tax=Mobilicoccus massiliensis TaxID=1522310 RepID=UPI000AB4313C